MIGEAANVTGVGRHILRLAGKHDDAAMRLLDWIIADAPHAAHIDRIWGHSLPRDPGDLVLAGAVLAHDRDRDITAGKQCA